MFIKYFFFISGHKYKMGAYDVYPRIILISDGKPTDFMNFIESDLYGEESPHNNTERVRDFLIDFISVNQRNFVSNSYQFFNQ